MKSGAKRVEVDRRGRFYQIESGESFPSVTNILGCIGKPALINWAASTERDMVIQAAANLYEDLPMSAKMSKPAYVETLRKRLGHEKAHTKELQKACEIGSEAHALIEWNLRKELGQRVGDQPQIGEKAAHAFAAYEEWRKRTGIKPIMIEQTIWSRKYGYAGTLDLCADVEEYNGLAVIDFKTGRGIYPESSLQIAAYAQALIEMGHAEVDMYGIVLRLPKKENDPEFEVKVITPQEQAGLFQTFLSVLNLWKYIQDNDKWVKCA